MATGSDSRPPTADAVSGTPALARANVGTIT
jgi:hypothetical protein